MAVNVKVAVTRVADGTGSETVRVGFRVERGWVGGIFIRYRVVLVLMAPSGCL
jgi:hypothetical protein